MVNILQYIQDNLATEVTRLVLAVVVLVVGWLLALLFAGLVRRGLNRTSIDNRIAGWLMGEEREDKVELERWIGRGVFWILMLFVLVGFFQVLGLTAVTEPLNRFLIRIFEFLPQLIAPVILTVVAWLVATALRFVVRRVLERTDLDRRLRESAGLEENETAVPLSKTLGEAVYWLVFLLFLPAILGTLELQGLLQPVQSMVDEMLAFLPNLLAAGLILGIGWLLARIIQRVVSNLLAAVGADRLSEQVGLTKALGDQKLSGLTGLVLYVLILIPVLVASLNALQLEAITRPASDMLATILSALPLLFGASLVLVVAFLVGRVVAGLVTNLLAGVGFDRVLITLGIGGETTEDGPKPSAITGHLVLIAIMLFATIEAVRLLGFEVLAELVAEFLVFAGHVVLGLVIFGVGLYLANLAAKTVSSSSAKQAPLLALTARVSITVLAGAMALREMGLANEIITIAFGLVLGAIAVAAALAFGLGCRDLAAGAARDWFDQLGSKPSGGGPPAV
jgi:hypothetical protein